MPDRIRCWCHWHSTPYRLSHSAWQHPQLGRIFITVSGLRTAERVGLLGNYTIETFSFLNRFILLQHSSILHNPLLAFRWSCTLYEFNRSVIYLHNRSCRSHVAARSCAARWLTRRPSGKWTSASSSTIKISLRSCSTRRTVRYHSIVHLQCP